MATKNATPRRKRSVPVLARQEGIGPKKIIEWIRTGELRAINLARKPDGRPRYAIDDADWEAFERSREVKPDAPPVRKLQRRASADTKEFF